MITLFCDIDNTLIYSYRRSLNTPKRVAEMLNGSEQSYITERTYNFLSSCKSISLVPVTSRTLRQYERVQDVIELLNCDYALILNGAVLINHGIIDDLWLNESRELAKDATEEMSRVAEWLAINNAVSVKYRDDFLIYASASSPETVSRQLNEAFNQSLVHSFFDSRKVYCAPTVINKGTSVKRLLKHLPATRTIGIGDSKNDLSMLENVDIPILPQSMETYISNPLKIVIPAYKVLSDAACEAIEMLLV